MDFWIQWKNFNLTCIIYLLNFGILGQIQLRSWHITLCCWDIINNKDESPKENNFSSRIHICICTKAELGPSLWQKYNYHLLPKWWNTSTSFFSTSESSANLWNLSARFPLFPGYSEVSFLLLLRFVPHSTMGMFKTKHKKEEIIL